MASSVQRLCHWDTRTVSFVDSLSEWQDFRIWRERQGKPSTSAPIPKQQSQIEKFKLWSDYLAYQKIRLDWAKSWRTCWLQLGGCEGRRANDLPLHGWENVMECAGKACTYNQEINQDVHVAELRLEASRERSQQAGFTLASLEHGTSMDQISIYRPLYYSSIIKR